MSRKNRREAPGACRVVLSVNGGVADVLLKPRGLELCIFDYDVEGEDPERLDKDPDGRPCCIQKYPASEMVVSHENWPIEQSAAQRIGSNDHAGGRWQCRECRQIVRCTEESLAEAGTPFCPGCGLPMQMI